MKIYITIIIESSDIYIILYIKLLQKYIFKFNYSILIQSSINILFQIKNKNKLLFYNMHTFINYYLIIEPF